MFKRVQPCLEGFIIITLSDYSCTSIYLDLGKIVHFVKMQIGVTYPGVQFRLFHITNETSDKGFFEKMHHHLVDFEVSQCLGL